jgi:hypothetical protein
MGWTGRAPAPNRSVNDRGHRSTRSTSPCPIRQPLQSHTRLASYGQEHPAFDRPRRQGGNRFAGKGRSRPDHSPARQCAAVPNRNRSWHGNALCGPRADCPWSRRKAGTARLCQTVPARPQERLPRCSCYFAQASKLGKAQFWPVADSRGKPPASRGSPGPC